MRKALLILILSFLTLTQAMANVVVKSTRIIYTGSNKEVTVKLDNMGKFPSLVQAWITAGDDQNAPDAELVPFILSPAISRIEPASTQTLRIVYTGEPLPQDRESLFYLNILDIPPKASAEEEQRNYLQFAFQSRFKMFYRPSGIKENINAAPQQVEWTWKPNGHNSYALQAYNPTPFFLTFNSVEVAQNKNTFKATETLMIPPFGSALFVFDGLTSIQGIEKVTFSNINDYGANADGEALIK